MNLLGAGFAHAVGFVSSHWKWLTTYWIQLATLSRVSWNESSAGFQLNCCQFSSLELLHWYMGSEWIILKWNSNACDETCGLDSGHKTRANKMASRQPTKWPALFLFLFFFLFFFHLYYSYSSALSDNGQVKSRYLKFWEHQHWQVLKTAIQNQPSLFRMGKLIFLYRGLKQLNRTAQLMRNVPSFVLFNAKLWICFVGSYFGKVRAPNMAAGSSQPKRQKDNSNIADAFKMKCNLNEFIRWNRGQMCTRFYH